MQQNGNGSSVREDASSTGAHQDLDEVLVRIDGVRGARVGRDHDGAITEIHILATSDRSPKQIVRDVRSMLQVEFGIDVDYRTISIVQLDGDAGSTVTDRARPAVARVAAEAQGPFCTVTVELAMDEQRLTGSARGATHAAWRLTAEATLKALDDLIVTTAFEIEFAGIVAAGSRQVALVTIRRSGTRGDSVLIGSADTARDIHDAVARATLDALNRSLNELP